MRCKEGLRAMEAAGTPLSVDGGVPVSELGEEMFTGTIEWVGGYMRASLKVTVIGLERSRGDEALEEVQESGRPKNQTKVMRSDALSHSVLTECFSRSF
jgi:hypothetical protein